MAFLDNAGLTYLWGKIKSYAVAKNANPVVIGDSAVASGEYSTAIGYSAKANASGSTALGYVANANGNYSTAIGYNAKANASRSTALGHSAKASASGSTALGHSAKASLNSTALGDSAVASGWYSTAIGHSANAGDRSTVLGDSANANGNYSTAIGYYSNANGNYSTALGYVANANGNYSTALGYGAKANGNYSTAIGYVAKASGDYSTALGFNANCTAANTWQFGDTGLAKIQSRVSISVTSDERDKKVIGPITSNATAFLSKLHAIRYYDNNRKLYLPDDEHKTDEDKQNEEKYGMYDYDHKAHGEGTLKGERVRVGVIAQEVISAMKEIYGDDSYGNIVDDNWHDYTQEQLSELPSFAENELTINYSNFIPFLIKSIQELDERITRLEDKLTYA